METVKVMALVNTLGLYPGDQVEIDRWPVIDELLRAGLLVELRPIVPVASNKKRRGKNVSVRDQPNSV